MTSVNFNYSINTDEEYAALVEYERRALAEIDKPILYASFQEPIPVIYTLMPQPVNLTPGALGVRCEE